VFKTITAESQLQMRIIAVVFISKNP